MNISLNSLSNLLENYGWKMNVFFSSWWMKLIMKIKGIEYGKTIRFYGLAKFVVSGNGIIRIGRNNRFRSSATSNLIGINRPCIITALSPNALLTIGDNCGFSGTVIGCETKITIGNNIKFGANTLITDTDWHLNDPRAGEPAEVVIGDNVWLGVNVMVLKGVTIGENSLIGAGSVVVKDIPANVVAAGNPCRVIKEIKVIK